ncbi:hypothetical protein MPTK1_1g07130 [Marchantia polymorpha subsp. ruderalis]|nr:hypothetical protein MARPO_0043s0106 [Marchantia polymorpha]BBM97631.1 hypothetical protein Mp_1g07130 [Marchantia polymorpha subsp. ruderalis]|eukprot:PTQ39873.1 hypothetical protein MARPO_0043s0106 [Marchantia polymorpha]
MVQVVETLLRVLPWLTTTLAANVIHYRSLFSARQEGRRHFIESAAALSSRRHFPGSSPDEHELLTFDLMQSAIMRKARYKIKVVHYSSTVLYVALFYAFLPELHLDEFVPGLGTAEGLVVGLLSGLVTILLDENRLGDMRTTWRPGVDYESRFWGFVWDAIRILCASSTPIEDCLFYHSWLYRVLVQSLSDDIEFESFTDVPLSMWSWTAWLVCNSALALYNGKEWRSSMLSGLLSLWVTARSGQLLDGVLALSVSRMTVNLWVVLTGQRQFW